MLRVHREAVLQKQPVRLAVKLEPEQILLGSLPALSAQLLDLSREHGRLTVAMAVAMTGANGRPT